ncbi:response regulator transcription factor [Rhizobacter sp. Root1221]|uniref:response regulator n=1 Tax=Rhizobacter sp. Root1221 TaxID=1736433 RepID=UPI0009EC53F5|nr:response regulator transcription factor [Rhizobacter sp. Root1221]
MPTEGPVRVLIVDDHIGIRNGLASLVNAEWPRMFCTGAAATPLEALTLARIHQPHVVVLDVNLAGDDGLALIVPLQQLAPCEIVVLTSLSDPHVAAHALRLGAHACLHKTAPAVQLVACIFAAHQALDGVAPLNEGGAVSRCDGSKHPTAQGKTDDVDHGRSA